MASFCVAASARYPSTLVAGLLPHHCPATRRISNLHLLPAGYRCFTRSCIVPRARVPPLRTPAEESLGYFSDSRRQRAPPPRHAAAVVVACALGTACLLRVTVFAAPLSLSRLARSRSITKPAASGDGKLDPEQSKHPAEDRDEDYGSRQESIDLNRKSPMTPIMLKKILFGKQTDSANIHLVDHVFTAVLPQDKQLQLLELVYHLAFPEIRKVIQNSKVFCEDWLSPYEKLEAGLAMAQIYMAMNKYKDADQVLKRLVDKSNPSYSESDVRAHLLKAVTNMMLVVDLQGRSTDNTLTEAEVKELLAFIRESKTCLDTYDKLVGSGPPREVDEG